MNATEGLKRAFGTLIAVAIAPVAIAGAAAGDVLEAGGNLVLGRPQKVRATPFVFEKLGELIFG